MTTDTSLYIRCECHSANHALILDLYEWPKGIGKESAKSVYELHATVQLNTWKGFFRRLLSAIRYVLRPQSHGVEGHWDTVIISPEKALEARDLIDQYLSLREEE